MGIFKIAGLGSTDLLVWPVFVCLTGHCNPSLCILQMVNIVVDNSKTIVGMSFVNGISPPPSFHSHLHHISLTAYHSNEYIHVDNVVVMFNPLYLLISSHLTCPYSCFIWDLVASTLASALLRTVMPITMSDAPNSHCHIPTSYKMSEFLQCPRMEESQCLQNSTELHLSGIWEGLLLWTNTKKMCYDEIALCAQSIDTILSSIIYKIGRAYAS